MAKHLLILGVALVLANSGTAQQLEPNDSGGSLQSNAVNPTPGTPFYRGTTAAINLTVGAAPNSPYLLVLAPLLTNSIAGPDAQFIDVDLNSMVVIVDGYNAFPGALPSIFGRTNGNGVSSWAIPLNGSALGQTFSFQAATLDPTLPSMINITAAASFNVVTASVQGDDSVVSFDLPVPMLLYGQAYSRAHVSTNGFIKFGTSTPTSDLSESTVKFLAGTAGSAAASSGPLIGVLWEDLDMANRPTSIVLVDASPGLLVVRFIDGDHYPSTSFGDIVCTISNLSGGTTVTLDYTGYVAATPPSEGIIGVSAGGTIGGTVAVAHELAISGVVNPFVNGGGSVSLFQNFDGSGTPGLPIEPFDLGGLILNFVDPIGNGEYSLN